MECPAYSPEMNPIEHIWNILGIQITGRQLLPHILQELEIALLEE